MVRAHLPNTDGKLKPGMLLTVAIETSPRLGLSVPELAIVGEGDARYVYTIDSGGAARRTAVRTGLRSVGRVEILEGLKPGQKVVTEGVVKLSEGMKVRVAGVGNAQRGPRSQGGAPPAVGKAP
jgi:membrane fusion protein (multidrug efflux system)